MTCISMAWRNWVASDFRASLLQERTDALVDDLHRAVHNGASPGLLAAYSADTLRRLAWRRRALAKARAAQDAAYKNLALAERALAAELGAVRVVFDLRPGWRVGVRADWLGYPGLTTTAEDFRSAVDRVLSMHQWVMDQRALDQRNYLSMVSR